MATLQEIYHLGLRQTQGLMASIGAVLHLAVAIPDYSTLSRRRATLEIGLPRRLLPLYTPHRQLRRSDRRWR
jgi:hypothetical protein